MHHKPKPRLHELPQLSLVPCRPIRQRMWQRAAGVVSLVLRRLPVGTVHEQGVHGDGGPRVHLMQLVLVHGGLLHGAGVLGGRGHGVRAVHGVRGGAVRGGGVRREQRRRVRDLLGVRIGDVPGAGLLLLFRQVRAQGRCAIVGLSRFSGRTKRTFAEQAKGGCDERCEALVAHRPMLAARRR